MISLPLHSLRVFLPLTAIILVPLLAGSGATVADAQTITCYATACSTSSDGTVTCVHKPIPCPPSNT